MHTRALKDIKNAVSSLPPEEFSRFLAWFEKVEAVRQREQKAALGKIQQGKTRIVSSLAEL
jgi:hypothetical protein